MLALRHLTQLTIAMRIQRPHLNTSHCEPPAPPVGWWAEMNPNKVETPCFPPSVLLFPLLAIAPWAILLQPGVEYASRRLVIRLIPSVGPSIGPLLPQTVNPSRRLALLRCVPRCLPRQPWLLFLSSFSFIAWPLTTPGCFSWPLRCRVLPDRLSPSQDSHQHLLHHQLPHFQQWLALPLHTNSRSRRWLGFEITLLGRK